MHAGPFARMCSSQRPSGSTLPRVAEFADENPVEVLNFDQQPRSKPGRRNNQTTNAYSLSASVQSLAAVTRAEHGNSAARIQRQRTIAVSIQPQRRQEGISACEAEKRKPELHGICRSMEAASGREVLRSGGFFPRPSARQ
jgi:hypothetical protein